MATVSQDLSATLAGYVEAIEMGQWDPFLGEKGSCRRTGAHSGIAASDCGTSSPTAWSISQGTDGVWPANTPADEALSWRGGGLSGSRDHSSVSRAAQLLNYDAVAISTNLHGTNCRRSTMTTPGDALILLYWPSPAPI